MIVTVIVQGILRFANEIDAPQRGACAMCGASMYLTKRKGHRIYALMPGQQHMCAECRKMDRSNILADIKKTTSEKFFRRFFDFSAGPGTEGGKGGDSTGSKDVMVTAVTTFRQMHIQGYLDSTNISIADGEWLSAITINPKFSYMLLGGYPIGKRVLQGKPLAYFDNRRTFRMKVFVSTGIDGRPVQKYLTIDLPFLEERCYEQAKQRLFTLKVDPTTKTTHIVRSVNKIAVVADWRRIDKGQCKRQCNWCCEAAGWSCDGYVYGEIFRTEQIYLMELPFVK